MNGDRQRLVVRSRRGPPIEVFFDEGGIEVCGMRGACLVFTQDRYLILADQPIILPEREVIQARIKFQSERVLVHVLNSNHTQRTRR